MKNEHDFDLWEKEYVHNSGSEGLAIVHSTIDFAQELQLGLSQSTAKYRKQMGLEALELLNSHPNDVKHHQFAFNVHHSYLTIHPGIHEQNGSSSKYGAMRVLGQVGLYSLDRFDDSGWLITLQLFDPVQVSVANMHDQLPKRLPAPLKLPVAAIELPVIQIK